MLFAGLIAALLLLWKLLPDGRDLVKINGSDLHSLVLIHLI